MRTSRILLSIEALETRAVMSTSPIAAALPTALVDPTHTAVPVFVGILPGGVVSTLPTPVSTPVSVGTLPGGVVSSPPIPIFPPASVGTLPGGVVSSLPTSTPAGWGDPGYVIPISVGPVLPWRHLHHEPIALHGDVGGSWNNETGTTQEFQGFGSLKPLGDVSLQGKLHLSEFIHGGKVTGTFTLTNSKGSVEIKVSEQFPTGGPTPEYVTLGKTYDLHFTIVGGTGAYRGATGSGSVVLTERPAQFPPPPLPGQPSPDYVIAPSFSMQFGKSTIHIA